MLSTPDKTTGSVPDSTKQQPDATRNRLKMRLADYLSPSAAANEKALFPRRASAQSTETGMNAVSKIKRREFARKLYAALEQSWVPTLQRVKAEALSAIKNHQSAPIALIQGNKEAAIAAAYTSAQSFGLTKGAGEGIVGLVDVTQSA